MPYLRWRTFIQLMLQVRLELAWDATSPGTTYFWQCQKQVCFIPCHICAHGSQHWCKRSDCITSVVSNPRSLSQACFSNVFLAPAAITALHYEVETSMSLASCFKVMSVHPTNLPASHYSWKGDISQWLNKDAIIFNTLKYTDTPCTKIFRLLNNK